MFREREDGFRTSQEWSETAFETLSPRLRYWCSFTNYLFIYHSALIVGIRPDRDATMATNRRRREDALASHIPPKRPWFSWTEIGLLFEILSTALVYFHCTREQAAQASLFTVCCLSCTLLLVLFLVTQNGVGPVLKMMFNSMLLLHMLTITGSFMMFHGFSIFAHHLVFAYELLTQ